MKLLLIFITFFIATLCSFSNVAWAQSPKPLKLLISVGELSKGPGDLAWKRKACTLIHDIAQEEISSPTVSTCRSYEPLSLMDTYLNQLKADNHFHIRLVKGYRNVIRIEITDWMSRGSNDFDKLVWTFRNESSAKYALETFFEYLQNEREKVTLSGLMELLENEELRHFDYQVAPRDEKIKKASRQQKNTGKLIIVF